MKIEGSRIPIAPVPGQIWRVADPRFDSFVRVEAVRQHQVEIRTVVRDGRKWVSAGIRRRVSVVSPARFNGERGGFELVEDAR